MTFEFLNDLCESRLISSKTTLKNYGNAKKLSELAYLYFIGLKILLSHDSSKSWAQAYCKKAGEANDFKEWRNSGNDLYVMLHAFNTDTYETDSWRDVAAYKKIHIAAPVIRHWLRNHTKEETHKLFARLDGMFNITDTSMKSIRRIVMEWEDADATEREDVLTKVIQMIHTRAPSNSELLPELKKMAKDDVTESATTGATGAASIATSVGGLGAGFDPDGDWRSVYPKKEKKPVVIRRKL